MTHDSKQTRRTVLRGIGAAVAGASLAGCAETGGNTGSQTSGGGGNKPDYGGWFSDVGNYEETVDETGSDSVTVEVGAEGGMAFAPAAVRVSPGTTVTWKWTGEGGGHNVVHEGGAFESELVEEAGHTFERTFDEAGTYKYFCEPHRSAGMKGAVVVGSE